MPRSIASEVYTAHSALYSASTANLSRVTIANDNVFGDNFSAQIAAQTPTLSGNSSVGTGYTGAIVVGLGI